MTPLPETTAITLDAPVFDVDQDGFWNAENWPGHRAPARYWVERFPGLKGYTGPTWTAKAELWVPTWLMPATRDLWWLHAPGHSCPAHALRTALQGAFDLERDRDVAFDDWEAGRACRDCYGTGDRDGRLYTRERCATCGGTGRTKEGT